MRDDVIASGVLRVHPRGFGFLVPDDRERFPDDVFVPKQRMRGAVDGDRVEVVVHEVVSEKGPEGHVSEVIRRGRAHVGGTIVEKKRGRVWAYAPLLGREREMRVEVGDDFEVEVGSRVILHVKEWGGLRKDPVGEVSAVVGHIGDPGCDVAAAVEEFELSEAFPQEVLREVRKFGAEVRTEEVEGRRDFREWECFTIDPETARDFDDALTLRRDEKGHFHLGVHIADVSHYVKRGSALDREAEVRCNSVYFPGKVVPMLPHELSSHLCSLMEGVDRLTASVLIEFDGKGNVVGTELCRGVIHSQKRFSYEEAKEVLDGKRKSRHKKTLELMVELCHLLKRKRAERGSIEFSLPDVQLRVDAEGWPERMEVVEYDITHQLVEEFMLKANEVVATRLAKGGKPLTYRVHAEPTEEAMQEFAQVAQTFGFRIPSRPTAGDLQRLFDEARGGAFGEFLSTAFIRSMKLATYSTENIGHYGLGLEYYTHFTSPIRRYIDLVVHRLLFGEKMEGDLEAVAVQCSERERLSARAEQSVVHLKKLRLLNQVVEDDRYHRFPAVVTAVKGGGFVFEVIDWMLEGFMPFGVAGLDSVEMGDKLEVQLEWANLITGEVRWGMGPKNKKFGRRRRR